MKRKVLKYPRDSITRLRAGAGGNVSARIPRTKENPYNTGSSFKHQSYVNRLFRIALNHTIKSKLLSLI